MEDAQTVQLGDKLYVGGGVVRTPGKYREVAKLYTYTLSTATWDVMSTPTYYFALITYCSELVLVGGREYVSQWNQGPITNKLWTLGEYDQWTDTLPPMLNEVCHVSAVEYVCYIIVAGGVSDGKDSNSVEVYDGNCWTEVQCLPNPCFSMKSTVLNGIWYLTGGERQGKAVYCASLDSLIMSSHQSNIWKRATDVPYGYSSLAVFKHRLIAIGGRVNSPSSAIHAYSQRTKCWVHVADMPIELDDTCTTVLLTGELMVIGGWSTKGGDLSCVYQATLEGIHNIILIP